MITTLALEGRWRIGRDPETRKVQVKRVIPTPPDHLFEMLCDTRTHAQLDSSGTLRGNPHGDLRLHLGRTFTMEMRQFGITYRGKSVVVEFEPGRRLAWRSTGQWRGRR